MDSGTTRRCWGVFGFCDIRNFTDCTECLQEQAWARLLPRTHTPHKTTGPGPHARTHASRHSRARVCSAAWELPGATGSRCDGHSPPWEGWLCATSRRRVTDTARIAAGRTAARVAQVIVFVNKIGSYVHNATQANYGASGMRAVLVRMNGVFFSARPSRRARALLYTPSAVAPLARAALNAPRMRLERSLLRPFPLRPPPLRPFPLRPFLLRPSLHRCTQQEHRRRVSARLGSGHRRRPAAAHCVPRPAGVSVVPPSHALFGGLRC